MGRPGQRSDSPAGSYVSQDSYGGGGSYGRASSEKPPVMSATVQFGQQDEYSGYSGGYEQSSGGRNAGRRMGLPSGPRGNR